jgi:nucleoside-diphosphate-sugar epimerase
MAPAPLTGRSALVTGATGFIGSPLVRRLREEGAVVYAVSRRPPTTAAADVQWLTGHLDDLPTVQRVFDAANPRLVFHLASHVAGARDLALVMPTFHSNLASTVNLLSVAAERGCDRIVLTGSLEEPTEPTAVPSSPYAAAKHAASGYARMFHALFGTPVTMLRLFMVYGPGQADATKLIPSVITALLRGEPPQVSSGSREVDWIYVEDVVAAMMAAVDAPAAVGATVDVGSGTLVSIRSIVEQLTELVNPRIRPLFGAVPDRPLEQVRVADTARTAALIGWKPKVGLNEGLRRTIEWYAERVVRG